MKLVYFFCMITVILFLSACTIRQADLTAISTREVNLHGVDLNSLPKKRVVGEDSSFVFLFIPFGLPQLEDAIDDALDKGGGDLMLDAIIYTRSWWFLIGEETIKVKGSVVNTNDR